MPEETAIERKARLQALRKRARGEEVRNEVGIYLSLYIYMWKGDGVRAYDMFSIGRYREIVHDMGHLAL